jgi:hypothetical protein
VGRGKSIQDSGVRIQNGGRGEEKIRITIRIMIRTGRGGWLPPSPRLRRDMEGERALGRRHPAKLDKSDAPCDSYSVSQTILFRNLQPVEPGCWKAASSRRTPNS